MKISVKRRGISWMLAILMVICAILPVPAFAESNNLVTISQTMPAIPADVGQVIDLSKYRLQVAANTVMEPLQLTWSSDVLTVNNGKVTAPAKGVYPLHVTNGAITRTVYLVVKEAGETEYVLYETDFSDASSLENWKKIQQTSGASYTVADGKLTMDASHSTSAYIRLMLPEFLGDFGDYHFEATGTITQAQNDKRYLALMFRIQDRDYPYYQMCVRQNASLSNGTEFAERTPSNSWNVTHTAPYRAKLSATESYTFAVDVYGKAIATSINGERLIYASTATKYSKGAPGLQVNGCSASFTSVKVTLTQPIEAPQVKLAEVRSPKSNLRQTPSIVTYVNTADDLNNLLSDSPATAILRVNSKLEVLDEKGTKIATVSEALKILNMQVIPAFYVSDEATVKALCAYLEKEEIIDVFIMSDEDTLVRLARDTYEMVRGIVDFTKDAEAVKAEMSKLREVANAAGARIAVIPAKLATPANVEALQRLFITVWVQSERDDTVELVSHITSGANGIITQSRKELERCFTAYFLPNTLTRVVNVIGHRGQPSTGQENSIASSIEGYQAGATMIENDIYLSRDGVLVVMHDSTIDRTTNGSGNIEAMTKSDLQRYMIDANTSKDPQPIPTLEDYFKEFKDKDMQVIVEIKSDNPKLLNRLAELIREYDMLDQVNVITFKYAQIQGLKQLVPGLSVGYLTDKITLSEDEPLLTVEQILKVVQHYDTTYNPSYAGGALGPNVMTAAGHRGVTFWPYTINKSEDFDTYFLHGTNGITTNYSYWVSDYLKNVTTEQDHYEIAVNEATPFSVIRTNYDRTQKESTSASIVVLSGNANAVSYKKGNLKITEEGDYTVIFRHACNLNNGKIYYMSTQPVTIHVAADHATSEDTTVVPAVTPKCPEEDHQSPHDDHVAFNILPVFLFVAIVLIAAGIAVVVIKKKKK